MTSGEVSVVFDGGVMVSNVVQNDELPAPAYHPNKSGFGVINNERNIDVCETDENPFLMPVTELSRLVRAKYVAAGLNTGSANESENGYLKQLINYKSDELGDKADEVDTEFILKKGDDDTWGSPFDDCDTETATPSVDREVVMLQREFRDKLHRKMSSLQGTLTFETRENILDLENKVNELQETASVTPTTILYPSLELNTFAVTENAVDSMSIDDIHGNTFSDSTAESTTEPSKFKSNDEVLTELENEITRIGGDMIRLSKDTPTSIDRDITEIDYIVYNKGNVVSDQAFENMYQVVDDSGDIVSVGITDETAMIPDSVFSDVIRRFNNDNINTMFASDLNNIRPHEMGFNYPIRVLVWSENNGYKSGFGFMPWYGSVTCTCKQRQQKQKYEYPICEHELHAMVLQHNDELTGGNGDIPPRYKRFAPKPEYNMFTEEFK